MMPADTNNPFVGLRPFETDESQLFFGRDQQVIELLQRLYYNHFVVLIGRSGSGKSSLIKAGLIPKLKGGFLVQDRDNWLINTMRPGSDPFSNLAAAILSQNEFDSSTKNIHNLTEELKDQGTGIILKFFESLSRKNYANFLLIIDQFEEIFRIDMLEQKREESARFINMLLELSSQKKLPIYVVVSLRSDFVGECVQFFDLAEAINQSSFFVPSLSHQQLKVAMEGPVKLYGSKISPSLVSRLLDEAGRAGFELPLLQHALMRTWQVEKDIDRNGELDLNDYEQIGGLEHALSKHADEALVGMNSKEFNLTKKIFQSLAVVDSNGRNLKRVVNLHELQEITMAEREQLKPIIDRFNRGDQQFLLVTENTDYTIIELCHETLIRKWTTLSRWIDEEVKSVKTYLQLSESAVLYSQNKKDLLAGRELEMIVDWFDSVNPSARWARNYNYEFETSITYLNQSRAMRDARKKKIRYPFLILLVLFLVLLIITLYHFVFE